MLEDLDNLVVMGGDASKVLPLMLPEGKIQHIFVNHPEPPQQTGGLDSQVHCALLPLDCLALRHRGCCAPVSGPLRISELPGQGDRLTTKHVPSSAATWAGAVVLGFGAGLALSALHRIQARLLQFVPYSHSARLRLPYASTQGFHLLTADFFGAMRRVLTPGGKLTIVTDNEWYASLLARIVSSRSDFSSFDLSKVGKSGKGADVKPKEVVGTGLSPSPRLLACPLARLLSFDMPRLPGLCCALASLSQVAQ